MRALIARDLADASLAGLSADQRFATAYNAALQAVNMAIACAGYRIMSKVGHHRVSLESTKLVLGKPMHKYVDYFETCRRKRNTIDYTFSNVCDGDGSEGDPHPSIPVLPRSRGLDYEKSPFAEEVERSRNGHCLDWANPHAQKLCLNNQGCAAFRIMLPCCAPRVRWSARRQKYDTSGSATRGFRQFLLNTL
jgi:hypothetical protein